MGQFWRQLGCVLKKNFLMNYKTKEFLRELISVAIFAGVIIALNELGLTKDTIPFYMTMAITSYSRAMVIAWVGERQTRQKEVQQIMGLNPYSHFIGWIIYFILNGLYVSIIFIVPLKFINIFDDSSFGILLGLYILYMFSSFFFVLFISTFFNDSKTAAQSATFIQLLSTLLYFLIYVDNFRNSAFWLQLSSILPPLAYDFGLISEVQSLSVLLPLNFTIYKGMISLGITTILYFLLFLYCEQVIPHQFGSSKHPLFFIRWMWMKKESVRESIQLLDMNSRYDTSSAKYSQDLNIKSKQTLQAYNVTKTYGDLNAVDHVTFSLYQKQIFCLLGHNGAGKSTTINILTGLSKKDSGKIIINDLDIDHNLGQVRKYLGLCLQQDVLYDSLSIEDHLRYYCNIKGVPEQQIEEQIRQTIAKCALGNEVGKLAKNLSGGNKRKLSLANALVGKSKIVFLDEPSSGLDPNSRQAIWDILKQIKNQNRTIVLTTHHLQEAENLAQRIAIMTHGKLLILGSCDYIKNKFGIGYHLLITVTQQQKQHVTDVVRNNFQGAQLDDQSATNVLKFILPLNRQKQFIGLFQALEPLNLNISLKMCTLQDAFVNIGMNDTDSEENTGQFPELPEIQQPLNISPIYNFNSQYSAVFHKKAISVLRSFSSIVSIMMPAMFMLIGTVVVAIAFRQVPSGMDPKTWDFVKMSVLGYFMVWAFLFNTSSFCGSIVLEREKKFKYLSNVMGLRKLPYWSANFSFDMLLYIIPVLIFFVVTLALGNISNFLTTRLPYLIPVFVLFGFSFMTFSYAWSFAFQKATTAYRFFPFLNFLLFYMIPLIPFFGYQGKFLTKYIMPCTSPFVAFYYVFFTQQIILPLFNMPSYGYILCVLGVQAIFFSCLTLFLQNIRFSLKDRYTVDRNDIDESALQDQDVKAEQERVRSLDRKAPIVCDRLYKKYNNGYTAIRNNTFMVQQGQMFGLLGPNGAGKSTTFNILTAAIPKTTGSVRIQNTQINKGIMEVFQNVGICPQFDSLYDNLTVIEHLKYFAQLKGNTSEIADKLVNYYLKIMQLDQYAKVKAGKLSGGNKRKLSVSMALIGNPKMMFFDEPSSAVDPIARRFLWKTLNTALRDSNASIVLTTHSMNQAQSLCSRIGILIKGKFVCMGTPASLKKKFGQGFSIIVKLKDLSTLSQIRQQLKLIYPTFKQYINQQMLKATFQIPHQTFVFSKTFQLFQNKFVQQNIIQSFEISQASLQQIFIFLSRMQPVQDTEVVRSQPWDFCCFQCGTQGCFLNI